ncbi:MAG: protease pro-enzyme activation domain-containing protein [Candidatus Sulfotelmatobacter sp.]
MKAVSPSTLNRRLTATVIALSLFCMPSLAPRSNAQQAEPMTPVPLITQPIDESQLTVLHGNTYPLARPQFDLGTAPASLPMQRMLLVLKRSPQQESALRKLLDNQQDKASPSYHKWLMPTEFGRQFGPTDGDIQTITTWLQGHGFQVGKTKGRTVLEFSGSASQVQEAFHTTIHKYIVNGEQHWANSSDPSIPTALTSAVAGVLTLHNFLKKPQLHLVREPARARIVPGKKPQVTFPAQNGQSAINALGPQDYAVIYNINPVYNSQSSNGNNNNGNESTIGVVGRSDPYQGGEDISNFRNYAFELCCGNYNIILNGPDPGDLGGGEEAEATLDTTWSGAVAPGATVDLVVSATTNTTDGIDLSEVYIVENNLADIMTESFSSCELYATDAQLAFSYDVAEQAAAQGITYFVSTGDDGAEGCDDPSSAPATHPISVNYLASTPFNVAVGGTMFNEDGQTSKYWGSEPPVEESAISYIPENVWNESSPTLGLWAGSGGASAGNIDGGQGGTTRGVPKPSWQSGVTGIPDDFVRDLPDVSLSAASHDPYLLCLEGSCQPNSQGEFYIYFVSGTSASTPSFAGIMALVDQQMANLNPAQGPRQGLANYVLYPLAANQALYPSNCNASNTTTPPTTTCIFNDVTVGNNVVPGEPGDQYQATSGYDQTTGLGSVNVANLVNQWNSVTFSPTTTTLLLNDGNTVSIVHGQSVTVNITVAPNSGSGTPTGDVSLLANTYAYPSGQGSVGLFTLTGTGSVVSSTTQLTGGGGGPYGVVAYYTGDATYAPSSSNSVTVTVTPEPSTTALSVLTATPQGNAIPFTGGPFGSFVYLRADVAGKSGYGTPTGSVTFTDTFGQIPGGNVFPLNGGNQINNGANTATPNGVLTFDTGTHTISASYSGDNSFNPSSTTQSQSFTITPGFFAAVPLNQSEVIIPAPGQSGSTSVSVSTSTGYSGTITLSCSGLPSGAACLFSQSSITATGTPTTASPTITVSTTAPTTAALRSTRLSSQNWLALASFMFFSVMLLGTSGRRRSSALLLVVLASVVLLPGCGGGGSGNHGPPPNPGTPTGTYNVVVNATSGSTVSATGFTLIVQ